MESKILSTLLNHYQDVFNEELGTFKGQKARIYVDPGAQLRFCEALPIPYTIRNKVEVEFRALDKQGILPVQFADWAPQLYVIWNDSYLQRF